MIPCIGDVFVHKKHDNVIIIVTDIVRNKIFYVFDNGCTGDIEKDGSLRSNFINTITSSYKYRTNVAYDVFDLGEPT